MLPRAQTLSVLDMTVVASIRALSSPGEPDLFVEVTHLFLADVPVQLSALWNAFQANDAELLWRLAHQVRGSAAGIGATRMADACAAMEEAARDGSVEAARAFLDRLDQEFNLVRTQLRQIVMVNH